MRAVAAALWIACLVPACSSDTGAPPGNGDGGALFDPCVADPQPGYDPTARGLPGCCTGIGPAHCVPKDQVLPALADQLMACDDTSVCMPDPIIQGGGQYMPKACTSSVGNGAGVCLSMCINRVANDPQAAVLGQDGCGDGELCVPCVNPFSGVSTGACAIIDLLCGRNQDAGTDGPPAMCPYTGPPVIDPKTLPECAPACGGAHCLPASTVPPAQQSLLSACAAQNGMPGLCTPDKLIETGGNFVPKSCTSVAGAEGRCLSTCLPAVAAKASLLPTTGCDPGEACVPCFDPTATDPTAPTGACSLACDKPTQPPVQLTCPYTGPPVIDPSTFPDCAPACGGAHCVPGSLVPASVQPLLATCGTGGFCAPDTFIASGGNAVPKSCASVAGAEGRCLSTCLPPVAQMASLLPKDACADGEKCVPCYNPTAADPTAPTGACSLACDKPAQPPTVLSCPWTGPAVVDPTTFPDCAPACSGAHCVPSSLVPSAQRALLATCGAGGYCTPDSLIATAGQTIPKTCTSIAGAEGRCLSRCLPDVAAQASLLPQDVCTPDERCVPCYNPTATDPTAATGACSIGCDKPVKPPTVITCPWTGPAVVDPAQFPACSPACGGAHCLPSSLVPPAQQALLATCPGGYCTPDVIIAADGQDVPPTCTSIAGAEGRCLSTCLPDVASQASLLPQSTCVPGTRCVPCYNPTATDPTAATGACSLACDKPTKPPVILTCPWTGPAVVDPAQLPSCASGSCVNAHCLPASLVPAAQQSLLKKCSDGVSYCTPDPIIQTDNNFVPKTCTSIAGAEGRCLSTCLPLVAQLASVLPQSTCALGEKCAPCYNPTATDPTAATGACSLACDKPAKPPVILTCPWTGPAVIDPSQLPSCASSTCSGAHCLPSSVVSPAQAAQLAKCADGVSYCTPDTIITTAGDVKPPSCTAFAGEPAAEGRCLSTCLPAIASQTSLEQSSCATGTRCAPCYDPITGSATGACTSSSCDQPSKPAYTFAYCCSNQGRCVPKSQVPSSQQSNLNTCTSDTNTLCVPNENLPGGSGGSSCTAITIVPPFFYNGTCISNCVNLGLGSVYPQGSCSSNHTCIPCAFAPAGSPGC